MFVRSVSRRFFLRLSLVLGVFLVIVFGFTQYRRDFTQLRLPFVHKSSFSHHDDLDQYDTDPNLPSHPIDDLINIANINFNALSTRETEDVRGAAATYRRRRKRHPPPNFGDWVAYAREKNAVIIEDLFDQIYHDLEPFWAIPPEQMQKSVAGLEFVVSIRNGTLTTKDARDGNFGLNDLGVGVWVNMFDQLKNRLPDVDIALNLMDEPRLLVPWDNIDGYIKTASTKGRLVRNGTFPSFTEFSPLEELQSSSYEHHWMESGNYWVLARDTCAPGMDARRAEAISDLSTPPEFPSSWPNNTDEGYISNWTLAKDPCSQPHLRGLHGTFIQPRRLKTSKDLFPIFSAAKLAMNNDILIPTPMSWAQAAETKKEESKPFWKHLGVGGAGKGDEPTGILWNKKVNKAFWRGKAWGGIHKSDSWARFQRQRLVSMMNATQVMAAELHEFLPKSFPLPQDGLPYEISQTENSTLWEWVDDFADAAFTDLMCYEKQENQTTCPYMDDYYKVVADQTHRKLFNHRYLPDIDGDTSSQKFLEILRSNSLPIKATIYNEWHDSRLIAWKHFVPMDNTFVDFWGIMDYFLSGRDAKAKLIAADGRKWADTVLRQDDLLVYVYRLVLEYARLLDKNREVLGYIGDLRRS